MPTNFITLPRSQLYELAWSKPVRGLQVGRQHVFRREFEHDAVLDRRTGARHTEPGVLFLGRPRDVRAAGAPRLRATGGIAAPLRCRPPRWGRCRCAPLPRIGNVQPRGREVVEPPTTSGVPDVPAAHRNEMRRGATFEAPLLISYARPEGFEPPTLRFEA